MIEELELLGLVVLAIIMGGAVGYEREASNKPAGLRTHMLVAGSAAMLTGLGKVLVEEFGVDDSFIQTDPIRIIEAVITGISFLGAGTILHHRGENKVEGLTTAASLLMVAALGVGVAMQQFVLTIGLTVIVVVILHFLTRVEK